MGAALQPACLATCREPMFDCRDAVAEMKVSCAAQEFPWQNTINHKLLSASRDGDHQLIIEALCSGAYVETRRPFRMLAESVTDPSSENVTLLGLTPLMYACKSGNIKCVQALIDARAMVNAVDEDGMTPLHFAAESADYEAFKTVLLAGGNPNIIDVSTATPLECLPFEIIEDRKAAEEWRTLVRNFANSEAKKRPNPMTARNQIIAFDESTEINMA
eukprot:TRINITY_DN76226_c0_g1_i1.p1 TRINITY_DN76226_c0_g1~~TRINITY_DN76226_c0_g1_i1.p1  ORF type:complete len:218 (-),score=41.86 TRINITY_DN76226_c0_g1_i1:75-728(-)